jgi:hypothetical protein
MLNICIPSLSLSLKNKWVPSSSRVAQCLPWPTKGPCSLFHETLGLGVFPLRLLEPLALQSLPSPCHMRIVSRRSEPATLLLFLHAGVAPSNAEHQRPPPLHLPHHQAPHPCPQHRRQPPSSFTPSRPPLLATSLDPWHQAPWGRAQWLLPQTPHPWIGLGAPAPILTQRGLPADCDSTRPADTDPDADLARWTLVGHASVGPVDADPPTLAASSRRAQVLSMVRWCQLADLPRQHPSSSSGFWILLLAGFHAFTFQCCMYIHLTFKPNNLFSPIWNIMNHSCGDGQFCHYCLMLDDRCHVVYTSTLVSSRGCAHMLVTASVIYMYFDQFTIMRFCCLTGQHNLSEFFFWADTLLACCLLTMVIYHNKGLK